MRIQDRKVREGRHPAQGKGPNEAVQENRTKPLQRNMHCKTNFESPSTKDKQPLKNQILYHQAQCNHYDSLVKHASLIRISLL